MRIPCRCYSSDGTNLAIKKLHARILISGFPSTSPLSNSKMIMALSSYSCEAISHILTTLLCYMNMSYNYPLPFTIIMSEFYRNGFPSLALHTFSFIHSRGLPLDTYSICSSLSAAASSGSSSPSFALQLHPLSLKLGWSRSSVHICGSLVHLYANSSLLTHASRVFEESLAKTTVSANALLTAFVNSSSWTKVVHLLHRMVSLELDFDAFTLSAALRASSRLPSLEMGRQVHGRLLRAADSSTENDIVLHTSLIEMYGRSGLADKAFYIFKQINTKDVVLWTTMADACGRNGRLRDVLKLYSQMVVSGVRMDGVMFLTLLYACSNCGDTKLGLHLFERMQSGCGVVPGQEHYGCLVHLLCKGGEVDKAWEIVGFRGGMRPSRAMWGAVINASLQHNGGGGWFGNRVLELDRPWDAGILVLLSNLCAGFGMWECIQRHRELLVRKGLKKDVGSSWISLPIST